MSIHRRERSAALIQAYIHMLKCPVCHRTMTMISRDHIQCSSRHSFDLARQGYINFMTRFFKGNYDKRLFTAKRNILTQSAIYTPLIVLIRNWIEDYTTDSSQPLHILDAGAGEGTLLEQITQNTPAVGWGIDIAKEGIAMASSTYDQQIWFVGDLAYSPFAEGQLDVILNILSPSNYEEFGRIMKPDGLIIKVIPREQYLMELRELLLPERQDHIDSREYVLDRFRNHHHLIESIPLTYTLPVTEVMVNSIIHMTPLSWHGTETAIASVQKSLSQITIDLEILVGKRR
ncbi:methyltransferase domain-containing protein [Paenibacillus sp. JNUCC31]|uniref:putative RNA methyltransferase n=1 Tax=Paenibacillus sp. JNUCC-31 TaxID=2777983 RepID=UPI0017874675|nr:methyltransferase domain-containing protein [Paenibacillus sp. JNUCC-31]QOS80670.1 methyltransferase domain-containing protein [Paenibacillus sp. JNUCC-31]